MGRTIQLQTHVTTPRVYLRRVEHAIYEALDEAVDATTEYGKAVAKRAAPVRKVTADGVRAKTRALTHAEVSELPDFVKKGLNPVTGASLKTGEMLRTTTRRAGASKFVPETRGQRLRETARNVEFDKDSGFPRVPDEQMNSLLTARGRYELRSERAIAYERSGAVKHPTVGAKATMGTARFSTRVTLGGTLRNEIRTRLISSASDGGGVAAVRLESPTDYAQYVEFPTSRTSAQPYMRPAREAMRTRLVTETRRAMERIGGKVT